jgi:lysozyme
MTYWDDLNAAQDRVTAAQVQLKAAQDALSLLQGDSPGSVLDVSEHNGDIDWVKARAAGVGVTFTRCSDGDYRDKLYTTARVSAIRSSGIVLGAYHYARIASAANNQRTPVTEAAMAYYFASSMGWGRTGDLPLVYDIEKDSGETTTIQGQAPTRAIAHVSGWVDAYQRLAGHYPLLYGNPDTFSTLLGAATATQKALLSTCRLWIAHVNVAAPSVPSPWTDWTFWQYSFTARVDGVVGDVDVSRTALSRSQLAGLTIV